MFSLHRHCFPSPVSLPGNSLKLLCPGDTSVSLASSLQQQQQLSVLDLATNQIGLDELSRFLDALLPTPPPPHQPTITKNGHSTTAR